MLNGQDEPTAISVLKRIEERLKKLMRESEDLNQMREDAKYAQTFQEMIVHDNFDG